MTESLVLDGKALAQSIEASLKPRVDRIVEKCNGQRPALATILVGSDPASATYVRMKGNACARVGLLSHKVELPDSATTQQLLAAIDDLNANASVYGILLQHPAPKQIDERVCFDRIVLEKDVDGVTCLGFGRMAMGQSAYGSATPAGIMTLLKHHRIDLVGRHAVVVGRSPILGKPLALMLLNAHATVTMCHSRTRDLPRIVRQADVVVGAVGKPRFIRADWIKPGSVIVDAGYHPGGAGDVDLDQARVTAAAYTPVPGGVGPMTIATLIAHTVEAAETRLGIQSAS
ncbi:MAG: bifunctional 5,10-methylene-tetrahydrofolate dehydrogenase/5,10-methylene-tetrahydrofolate cyclohydrolase [Vicinamibacteria bacterium]|nr:bifunctional 5,10-methylene-tetrahydrofolate dehydrogenase/5,10-methylene-tetrahydrofolate cyclohydrolase [Vicinamibacteria bacterium]